MLKIHAMKILFISGQSGMHKAIEVRDMDESMGGLHNLMGDFILQDRSFAENLVSEDKGFMLAQMEGGPDTTLEVRTLEIPEVITPPVTNTGDLLNHVPATEVGQNTPPGLTPTTNVNNLAEWVDPLNPVSFENITLGREVLDPVDNNVPFVDTDFEEEPNPTPVAVDDEFIIQNEPQGEIGLADIGSVFIDSNIIT